MRTNESYKFQEYIQIKLFPLSSQNSSVPHFFRLLIARFPNLICKKLRNVAERSWIPKPIETDEQSFRQYDFLVYDTGVASAFLVLVFRGLGAFGGGGAR